MALDSATQRLWRIDGPTPVPVSEVEGLPRGYGNFWQDGCTAHVLASKAEPLEAPWAPYLRPSAADFRRLVAPGSRFYWMSETGRQCAQIRALPLQRPRERVPRDPARSDSSLEAFASIEVPEDASWGRLQPYTEPDPWIPFVAVPPRPGHHGYLLMGTWQTGAGHPFFKCQCERLLRVVRLDTQEIQVLTRRLRSDLVQPSATVRHAPTHEDEVFAYDSREVERWFWDEASCERARTTALANIAKDGRLSVESGFYSGYSQFE